MARPPIKNFAGELFKRQLDAALDYLEGLSGGATNLAYVAATRTVTSDTGTDATLTLVDVSNPGLMASADKTALDSAMQPGDPLSDLGLPVSAVGFNQQQAVNFVIENRTSDPGSPVAGQIWIRTDL